MNSAFLLRHIGTLQLLALTAVFALPLVSGTYFPFFDQASLDDLLATENDVIIYGFLLAGFVLFPLATLDSIWVRGIRFLVAIFFVVALNTRFQYGPGLYGLLGFSALLFANFGSVFVDNMAFRHRQTRTGEVALRCVVWKICSFRLIGAFVISIRRASQTFCSNIWKRRTLFS